VPLVLLSLLAVMIFASPALAISIGPPVKIGMISSTSLPEVSGIVDSRAVSDAFWVHNDRGDSARFFAMGHAGNLLGTFPLAGATATDWEDIAINAKPGGGNYLYLGDIGDNDTERTEILIHRVDEPTSTESATIAVGSYSTATLLYPNGARNAESLLVDPLTSDIYIITKSATTEIYSAPISAFDSATATTLVLRGILGSPLPTASAADISPDGRHILVRNRTAGYLFERRTGQSVADALEGTGIPFALGAEPQGEAIGWDSDGTSFYTASESNGSSIYRFDFEPTLYGDYNGDRVVNAVDYTVWRNLLGTDADLQNEEVTIGSVTFQDYGVWKAHYGESLDATGASSLVRPGSHGVPEPASIALLMLGVTARLLGRRRRTQVMAASAETQSAAAF
jgi:hypothetical protein